MIIMFLLSGSIPVDNGTSTIALIEKNISDPYGISGQFNVFRSIFFFLAIFQGIDC